MFVTNKKEEMKTHSIKFLKTARLDVASPQNAGRVRTHHVKVNKGECVSGVTVRAYVEELVEKCDIAFADGSEALGVHYGWFEFLDSDFEDEMPGVDA